MHVMLTHLLIFASLLCQKKIEILSLLFIERLPLHLGPSAKFETFLERLYFNIFALCEEF